MKMTLEERRLKKRNYMRAYTDKNREKMRAIWRKSARKRLPRLTLEEDSMYQYFLRRANPEKHKQYRKTFGLRHPERVRAQWNKSTQKRLQNNLHFKILFRVRNRINIALRRRESRKSERSIALLGCSIPSFQIYLESKFEPGMTWENYGKGGWQIDHIIPCAIFDLTKPEHQRTCFHFSNCQPMWAEDNNRKGASVPEGYALPSNDP